MFRAVPASKRLGSIPCCRESGLACDTLVHEFHVLWTYDQTDATHTGDREGSRAAAGWLRRHGRQLPEGVTDQGLTALPVVSVRWMYHAPARYVIVPLFPPQHRNPPALLVAGGRGKTSVYRSCRMHNTLLDAITRPSSPLCSQHPSTTIQNWVD